MGGMSDTVLDLTVDMCIHAKCMDRHHIRCYSDMARVYSEMHDNVQLVNNISSIDASDLQQDTLAVCSDDLQAGM
jgi:hypothetical protein